VANYSSAGPHLYTVATGSRKKSGQPNPINSVVSLALCNPLSRVHSVYTLRHELASLRSYPETEQETGTSSMARGGTGGESRKPKVTEPSRLPMVATDAMVLGAEQAW
jgi:hypothetical protein